MADDVTDKEVEQARAKVDKLNAAIEEARTEASANLRSGENAVRKARLDAEAIRLQAELDAIKAANKPRAQRDATAAVVADVTEGQAAIPTATPVQNEEK